MKSPQKPSPSMPPATPAQHRRLSRFYAFLSVILLVSMFLPWIDMNALGCFFHNSSSRCQVTRAQTSPHAGAFSLLELGFTQIDLNQVAIQESGFGVTSTYDVRLVEDETTGTNLQDGVLRPYQVESNHTLDLRICAWGVGIIIVTLFGFSVVGLFRKRNRQRDVVWIQWLLFAALIGTVLFYISAWDLFREVSEVMVQSTKLRTQLIILPSSGFWIAFGVPLMTLLGLVLSTRWQQGKNARQEG